VNQQSECTFATSVETVRGSMEDNCFCFVDTVLRSPHIDTMVYTYSPQKLVQSFDRLKDKEEELLERTLDDDLMDRSEIRNAFVVAATQISGTSLPDSDVAGFCFRAENAIEQAVQQGANLVLLPELWSGPYFCQSQESDLMMLSSTLESSILIKRMKQLAKLYSVVLPVSFYENKNNVFYNSVAMIDSDGTVLGVYRKSHIPDGPGYQEKFYFTPGDTGFRVFDTKVGKVGVAICWDQWFPEAARAMALLGADVLLYPTSIGSEPHNPTFDSSGRWQRVMQGHAAANMIPVVASNRYGTEILLNDDGTEKQRIVFYGRSFITNHTGEIVQECAPATDVDPVSVVVYEINREQNFRERASWGLFRDRRPDLYQGLLTKDGRTTQDS
jgi:N-carbamoylputrescine amidase